jgi:hypothetical protein
MNYLKVLHKHLDSPKFSTTSITDVFFEDVHDCLVPYLILLVPTLST